MIQAGNATEKKPEKCAACGTGQLASDLDILESGKDSVFEPKKKERNIRFAGLERRHRVGGKHVKINKHFWTPASGAYSLWRTEKVNET